MTLIAGLAAVLASPAVAVASCIAPPPFPEAIDAAPAVFVGEVIDLSGSGRWATVEVRDVWSGGNLATTVEVRGGPRADNVHTSADRHFKLSREYLFVPYERKGSVFLDNACTRTTAFRPGLTSFRPQSATEPLPTRSGPSPSLDEDADVSRWLLAGAAIAGLIAMTLVILRRR